MHYYSVVTVQLFVQLWGVVVRYDGDDFVAFIYFSFMRIRKEEMWLFKKKKCL